jgi:predicted extracellular nuclease
LDISLRLEDNYILRLVGAHLKSQKQTVGGDDSGRIRLTEAQLLANHIRQILKFSPYCNLLVFGDFNDHPNSPVLKEIFRSTSLVDLAPSDDRGDRWTYHFSKRDVYSRFDYLLASPGLIPEIVDASICHFPHWNLASDHRPLYLLISTRPLESLTNNP